MSSQNKTNLLMDKVYELLKGSSGGNNGGAAGKASNDNCGISINRSGILIIAGLLGGVLQVDSVLMNREQTVQIVLSGSLKRKSDVDKMLDSMGSMTFDDAMRAIIGHFV